MKNTLHLLTITLSIFLLHGCTNYEEPIQEIVLNETVLSLKVDETHSFFVLIIPSHLEAPPFFWKTSDSEVISIDNNGLAKALSLGEATITVHNAEHSLQSSCRITVKATQASEITLDKVNLALIIDEEYELKYELHPQGTTYKEVTWTSANTDIATVNSNGKVKAIGVGTTTITIFNHDKTVNASCTVNVGPIEATEITLNMDNVELFVGDFTDLKYSIKPEKTTNKEVKWSSANSDIATVNAVGKVEAVGVGETTITVKANDKTFDTCKIKVNPIRATKITLNVSALTMNMNETNTLSVNFTPTNTTNKKIIWTSTDESIASVSDTGMITAIKEGTIIIRAKSEDGSLTAYCTVKVVAVIYLSSNKLELLPGETKEVFVLDLNDSPYFNGTWESANPSVATVAPKSNGQSGIITAVSKGSSKIIVTSIDGSTTAECIIKVN